MIGKVERTLVVPMNPHGEYSGGGTPGSIISQQWFAEKAEGKVIISFDRGCRYRNSSEKPNLGFFYDCTKKRVTHRFSIIDITDDWNVVKFLEENVSPWSKRFLPPWRSELYEEAKTEPTKRRTWMLISDICRLKEPKSLEYFDIKRLRSPVYSSKGSELEYIEEKTDPYRFIDEVIWNAVIGKAKFREHDLELIVWALMVKHEMEYIARQRGKKGYRLDLLTKTPEGEYVVIELKRGKAEKETLVQIRKYMNKSKRDFQLSNLKGVIIARDASQDLIKELEKLENRNVKFASFSFSIGLHPVEYLGWSTSKI
jgi:hypothetical protein